jgi:hypothetical protein
MGKGRWVELLVDEITNVTNDNQDEVTTCQLKISLVQLLLT